MTLVSSRRRRRGGVQATLLALLVPIAATGIYLLCFAYVPEFADYTWVGLRRLGIYDRPPAVRSRKPIVTEHGRFLWGGRRDEDHFDITIFRLDTGQLRYGLGRERFPALIEPRFVTVAEVVAATDETRRLVAFEDRGDRERPKTPAVNRRWPGDGARVLTVQIGDAVRIYPLDVLRRHEVVNDVVEDRPIFVAYCYLADLAAAYDRRYGEHVLTFAVSGYTYHDDAIWDGRDAFVLWDRETESLWWPPTGQAVSGPLVDAELRVLDATHWSQTTWGAARAEHPNALVLSRDQSFTPPSSWPRLDPEAIGSLREVEPGLGPRLD